MRLEKRKPFTVTYDQTVVATKVATILALDKDDALKLFKASTKESLASDEVVTTEEKEILKITVEEMEE